MIAKELQDYGTDTEKALKPAFDSLWMHADLLDPRVTTIRENVSKDKKFPFTDAAPSTLVINWEIFNGRKETCPRLAHSDMLQGQELSC